MPLEQWFRNGWLKTHQPTRNEIVDACRAKRNTAEYDCAGVVTKADADELVGFVREFKPVVLEWLRATHPELL